MSLYPYLIAIKENRPLNARRFGLLLEKQHIDIHKLGSAEFLKKNHYRFTVTDQALFELLIAKYSPAESRLHATKQGNSHKHITRCAYVNAKHLYQREGVLITELVCIACSADTLGPKQKQFKQKQFQPDIPVVLIENSDCFTYGEEFLMQMGLDHLFEEVLLVLSNGNAITHKESLKWLSGFNKVYYCPDYDLAGISIFETLKRQLPKAPVFVVPNNLLAYKPYCVKPKQDKQLFVAIDKAKTLNLPEAVIELFRQGLGFLEQEIFLGHIHE